MFKKLINKKVLITIILILFFLFVYFYFKNKDNFDLKINVNVSGSQISISDEKNTVLNSDEVFDKKLKRGLYKVVIKKDGYIPEIREVNLNKDTNLQITMLRSLVNNTELSVKPVSFGSLLSKSGFDEGVIYGINRENGFLVKFDGQKQTTIYNKPIEDYDIKGNTAVILERGNLSGIIVLDLTTLTQRTLNMKNVEPVTSVSLTEDSSSVFFLSGFSINGKISDINSVTLNGNELKTYSETSAQRLEVVNNDLILLYQENHAQDKNSINLYQLSTNKIVLKKTVNTYKLSPNKDYIFIQRLNNVEKVNIKDFKNSTLSIKSGSRFVWKNNNTIILLKNNEGNVQYSILTTNPLNATSFQTLIEGSAVLSAFGLVENKLYLQDYNNKMFSLNIPN